MLGSPDPFIPNPFETASFNRYSYVQNNPLNLTDPSGFDPEFDIRPGSDVSKILSWIGDALAFLGSGFSALGNGIANGLTYLGQTAVLM